MGSLDSEIVCARYNHNGKPQRSHCARSSASDLVLLSFLAVLFLCFVGKIVASCSVDGGICLDVAASGELLSRFFSPATSPTERIRGITSNQRINSVHFSSGSRFLASGGVDGCVRIWDLKTQEVAQTYSISASAITSVTFSGYKDEHIAAGTEQSESSSLVCSGAISVCDVQSSGTAGFLTVNPKHGVYKVTSTQSSPHPYARHALGATYGDGSVRVWDLNTAQLTSEFLRPHEATATSLAISPVSKVLLASGGLDGRVLFFDTIQSKELRAIEFDQPISALALCADGKTFAVGTTHGEILVYDLRGVITPLYSTRAHDSAAITSLQFAASSADSSVASVFPQGVPVVSAEQIPSGKLGGGTLQDAALRKLESLGIGSTTNTSAPPPPTATTRPSSSPTRHSTTSPQSNVQVAPSPDGYRGQNPTRQMHPPTDSTYHTRQSSQCQNSMGASSPEPSLLSLLAASGSAPMSPRKSVVEKPPQIMPLPSSSANNRHSVLKDDDEATPIRERIQFVRHELETQHRTTFDQISSVLEEFLHEYEALAEENRRLRHENEQLQTQTPPNR
ncbi:Nuclear protein cop1, partial [Globisporangium splendens]